jgi:hypothetical protein
LLLPYPDPDNWFYIEYAVKQANVVVLGCGDHGRRWGMPTLLRNYSFAQLLEENHDKLRVFGYVNEDQRRPYPKHPHPLMNEHRFSLDHELIVVTEEKREAMLLLPRTCRRRQVVDLEE